MKRNEYFDFLRGVAIIFVVGIHAYSTKGSDCAIIHYGNIFLRQIFNCAVPLFLAISGYFLGKVDLDTKQQRLSFWKKQIPKVYIPCLIWSLLYFDNELFQNASLAIKSLATLFLCGFGVFYFVMVIILMYLFLPFIKKYCKIWGVILFATLSLPSIFLMNYHYMLFDSLPGGLVSLLAWPTHWLGFFALGIYLANSTTREYKLLIPLCVLLIGLVLSTYEASLWPKTMGERLGYKFSAFIYSYGAVLFLFSKKIETLFLSNIRVVGSTISKIGVISFGIYLIHFKIILYRFFDNWIINWFVTLLLTISIILIIKKIFPQFSKKYLGLY